MDEPHPDNTPNWRARWFGAWKTEHPATEAMLAAAESWAKYSMTGSNRIPQIMLLIGPPQTGKTRLAAGVRRYWGACGVTAWDLGYWRSNPPVVEWVIWSDIALIDAGQRDGKWGDVARADLAVIDDVGAEVDKFKSGVHVENMRLMLEHRLAGNRKTLITTNLSPEKLAANYDARVFGRLTRDAAVCSTVGVKPWKRERST